MSAYTIIRCTTPHYKFDMHVKETLNRLRTFSFRVGDLAKPCLDGVITLENLTKNDRLNGMKNTATLGQIEALMECSLDEITAEYMEQYSFGSELLDAILFFIHQQFETIDRVRLTDTSYIPCIRDASETLDLLTYSIALYGKTWYEQKKNAHLEPVEKHMRYRQQVEEYMSVDKKTNMTWDEMHHLMQIGTNYTKDMLEHHDAEYKSMFNGSPTLPDFFKTLSKTIPRKDKCKFFKKWLENFIMAHVMIERIWYIDLYPKMEVIQIQSKKGGKRSTRKNKRSLIPLQ